MESKHSRLIAVGALAFQTIFTSSCAGENLTPSPVVRVGKPVCTYFPPLHVEVIEKDETIEELNNFKRILSSVYNISKDSSLSAYLSRLTSPADEVVKENFGFNKNKESWFCEEDLSPDIFYAKHYRLRLPSNTVTEYWSEDISVQTRFNADGSFLLQGISYAIDRNYNIKERIRSPQSLSQAELKAALMAISPSGIDYFLDDEESTDNTVGYLNKDGLKYKYTGFSDGNITITISR